MKKFLLATGFFCLFILRVQADEGMWIPSLLQQMNEKEMQNSGLRISTEDIYSINHSSLKDAILLFGGGCTAEIVSPQGLILTNYHCGFSQVQAHSSLENDYLTTGFWAMRPEEELQCTNLTAELLIRMEDVTSKVLEGVSKKMTEKSRDSVISVNIKKLSNEARKGNKYEVKIKPFYNGNAYYMFVVEIFKDIRMVGAPPSNIGKFGGDTDNWMWPRHTGDFAVFRIYTGRDNLPAEYSKDNIPYTPKKHLPISMKGYDNGDFTFVYGFPGRTQQFIPSFAIELISQVENPIRIKLREKRLEVIDRYMNQNPLTRIQYVAKAATIANGWKKWIGENKGLKRLQTLQKKRQNELDFQTWVFANPERRNRYQNLLKEFDNTYKMLTPVDQAAIYYTEAGQAVEIIRYVNGFSRLVAMSKDRNSTPEQINAEIESLKGGAKGFFKNYNPLIDQETMPFLLKEYAQNTDPQYKPAIFAAVEKNWNGNFGYYCTHLFQNSILVSEEKVLEFLSKYKPSRYKKLEKDPLFVLARSMNEVYTNKVQDKLNILKNKADSLQRVYTFAIMEMSPGRRFYPDANLTLRVAYGKILDYSPMDGVRYNYFTSLAGIMEKEDPSVSDYSVNPALKNLYNKLDFGPYADKDGDLHTCFIANNHTSGGNSGSPVFNSEGQLIGINFDRNWEGTMSDINYDPDQCRNITLDIRYCLFVIDKVCGAGHLVKEMTLVR